MQGRPLPGHWGQRPMRYISRPEAARLITGPWWPRREAYGNKGKLFLYTALADMLPNYIRYFDGVVYTPHSVNDVHSLLEANNFLLDYKDELMESKSLRLNLFPDIKKAYS